VQITRNLFSKFFPDFIPIMMILGIFVEGLFVWYFEFGHWDLFEIWILVLGILVISVFSDFDIRVSDWRFVRV